MRVATFNEGSGAAEERVLRLAPLSKTIASASLKWYVAVTGTL